jgi:hypothetical protein
MADLYQPQYKLTINNFDVSTTIAPYLISISLQDFFDNNFTVSKLEIIFHAKYKRSSAWQYKDQLKLELWWKPFPTFKYISDTFYVDYVEDIKNPGGLQTFRVSALSADPSLGFTYGVKKVTITDKTTIQAVTDFATLFGLTVSQNMKANIQMAPIKNILGSPPPSLTTSTITFDSYADMLKYICQKFGYYGNISGKNLQIYQIDSAFSSTSRFFLYALQDIYGFEVKQTYTDIYKTYGVLFVDRTASNAITRLTLSPVMSAQLNNKIQDVEYEDAFFNRDTAAERLYGEMYQDYYSGFEIRITQSAVPEIKAGSVFLLDASYGAHEGYYRCIQVNHIVDSNGWNAEITGFPINILESTSASFKLGYTGNNYNPPVSNTISLSQLIRGTAPTITAANLDAFAKYYNPNYTLNIGATFLSESNKTANGIRPDIAFCLALVLTENFTVAEYNNKFNPGVIGDSSNTIVATFTSWQLGIRAEVQHLFAFATTTGTPADAIVDPRYTNVTRGSSTKIQTLNSLWNNDLDLATLTKEKLRQLYIFINPTFNVTYID